MVLCIFCPYNINHENYTTYNNSERFVRNRPYIVWFPKLACLDFWSVVCKRTMRVRPLVHNENCCLCVISHQHGGDSNPLDLRIAKSWRWVTFNGPADPTRHKSKSQTRTDPQLGLQTFMHIYFSNSQQSLTV